MYVFVINKNLIWNIRNQNHDKNYIFFLFNF